MCDNGPLRVNKLLLAPNMSYLLYTSAVDGDDRRRRSVMHPLMWRKLNPAVPGRKRRQRQSGGGATVDCQSNPQRCIFFSCNISDLPRDEVGIVRIEGVVDERFYEVSLHVLLS